MRNLIQTFCLGKRRQYDRCIDVRFSDDFFQKTKKIIFWVKDSLVDLWTRKFRGVVTGPMRDALIDARVLFLYFKLYLFILFVFCIREALSFNGFLYCQLIWGEFVLRYRWNDHRRILALFLHISFPGAQLIQKAYNLSAQLIFNIWPMTMSRYHNLDAVESLWSSILFRDAYPECHNSDNEILKVSLLTHSTLRLFKGIKWWFWHGNSFTYKRPEI